MLDPSLSIDPLFSSQNVGGEILLNCTPSDNTSEVGWLKNNEMINENDSRISYLPNGLLRHVVIISDAQLSDEANYSCALNRSGNLIDVQRSVVIMYRGTLQHCVIWGKTSCKHGPSTMSIKYVTFDVLLSSCRYYKHI